MIGFATKEMIPDLVALWCECFNDTTEYASFVFEHRCRPEQTLVDVREGAPVAMLWLIPAELRRSGGYVPVWYVYAVATAKAWRGKGISTALLARARELASGQGIEQLILTPAGEGLFGFYRDRGYHNAFSVRYEEFEAAPPSEEERAYKLTAISPRMYQQLRDKCFEREGYVRWDEAAITYVLHENRFVSGLSCRIDTGDGSYLALCVRKGDTMLVKETTLPDAALRGCLSKLARKLGCAQVRVRLAPNKGANDKPFAMAASPEAFGSGYLNLVLD